MEKINNGGVPSARIIGGNGERKENDFYPTPVECTEALMEFTRTHGLGLFSVPVKIKAVWEPACGDGAISKVLERYIPTVYSSDIRSDEEVYGMGDYDFLTKPAPAHFDWIITNPPFNLAEQFIRRCASYNKPFALLLKSQYWHSSRRKPLFDEIKPGYILPLTWRPDFCGQGGPTMDFSWVVWGAGLWGITQYIPLDRPGTQRT